VDVFVYCQFWTRNAANKGVQLLRQYPKPHTAPEMNKEIVLLLSLELDLAQIDSRFMALLCPTRPMNADQGDDKGILMNGIPTPSTKKQQTRPSQRSGTTTASGEENHGETLQCERRAENG
jgi:hypothetical protein